MFNLLITNVDDHLQNLGFLYVGQAAWRLAPAFDVNPFPDKDRESKTWLSEDMGPVTSLSMLMERGLLQSAASGSFEGTGCGLRRRARLAGYRFERRRGPTRNGAR